jgi:hypothetical protein
MTTQNFPHGLFQPTKENAARAREILEKRITTGRQAAVGVYKAVQANVPVDALVRGKALQFVPDERERFQRLTVKFDNTEYGIDRHALGQLSSRAGIPGSYLAGLAAESGWQRELAADILNRHYHDGATNNRFLVRSIGDNVRGVLSDHYRRLDSRPLLDAFVDCCKKVGAVPIDGVMSTTRVSFKALIPEVFEPAPGEVIAFGLEWHNSDYGNGAHTLRPYILRPWCLNGATMENALSQVHLGGRLSEEFEMSERTYELDTATSVSALRDIVQGVFAPPRINAMCEAIRTANEKNIDWKNLKGSLAKRLLKGELEAAEAAFDSSDVINLPAGKTMWRASNAISWIAGKTEDADRRLDLERLAGELAGGKRDHVQLELAA